MIKTCDCKKETYVGQVVKMFVSQSSSDDYFMAVVFDGQSAKNVQWSTTAISTRCSICGSSASCTVDASIELTHAYNAYINLIRTAEVANDLRYGRKTPSTGAGYSVVRGRKIAIGVTGICSSVRFTQFGSTTCLQTTDGYVWVDSKNLCPKNV